MQQKKTSMSMDMCVACSPHWQKTLKPYTVRVSNQIIVEYKKQSLEYTTQWSPVNRILSRVGKGIPLSSIYTPAVQAVGAVYMQGFTKKDSPKHLEQG
jgi:hypothetical protein